MTCRHCRGRGWISTGIYGWDQCDCEEDEVVFADDEQEETDDE
jgi:hypothetical protein